MSTSEHLKTGKQAETFACQYLTKQGLILREKNFRCRMGEIDLIMQDKNHLIFIEVRYRQNNKFGSAAETISFNKQQRIINTAHYYLQTKQLYDQLACRFDAICLTKSQDKIAIDWIKHAFTL